MTITMANCSDTPPNTDVFYSEISSDTLSIALIAIACLLAVVCIALFVEEIIFLQQVYHGNQSKIIKRATLLGLFPVVCTSAVLDMLVPSCGTIVDLIAACYLSVCIYTFVTMIIDYFGGDEVMVETLKEDMIRLNTPPCCCCCCCILKPITLTEKSLLILKLFALQVAVVRPVVLLIGAILWTDGKYEQGKMSATSAYTYISAISTVSTVLSIYGLIVIFRGTRLRLKHHLIDFKFVSLQITIVLVNLQNMLFNLLAQRGIPECIGSRGPRVRAMALNHALLVIEAFLLSLLARKGYRREDSDPPELTKSAADAGLINVAASYDEENGHVIAEKRPVKL